MKRFAILAFLCLGSCQSSDKSDEQSSPKSEELNALVSHEREKPAVAPQREAQDVTPVDKPSQETHPPLNPKSKRSAAKAKILFSDYTFDFGEIWHAEKVTHKFEFKNEGNRDLEIKNAKASCGCTTPSYPFLPIAPGESGFIGVTYNSVGKQGFQRANIRVQTNDSDQPEVVLKLMGRVKVKPKEVYEAEQAAKKKSETGIDS